MMQEGKTLLELIMVLTIIGLFATLAGPNLVHVHSRIQLRAVTEEIASELRLARQLATTHRDRVVVAFDFGRELAEIRFLQGPRTHHVYNYKNKGVTIDEPSGGAEIMFHPSGRSATGTTIRLRSREGWIREVTVGLNGRVRIR